MRRSRRADRHGRRRHARPSFLRSLWLRALAALRLGRWQASYEPLPLHVSATLSMAPMSPMSGLAHTMAHTMDKADLVDTTGMADMATLVDLAELQHQLREAVAGVRDQYAVLAELVASVRAQEFVLQNVLATVQHERAIGAISSDPISVDLTALDAPRLQSHDVSRLELPECPELPSVFELASASAVSLEKAATVRPKVSLEKVSLAEIAPARVSLDKTPASRISLEKRPSRVSLAKTITGPRVSLAKRSAAPVATPVEVTVVVDAPQPTSPAGHELGGDVLEDIWVSLTLPVVATTEAEMGTLSEISSARAAPAPAAKTVDLRKEAQVA